MKTRLKVFEWVEVAFLATVFIASLLEKLPFAPTVIALSGLGLLIIIIMRVVWRRNKQKELTNKVFDT